MKNLESTLSRRKGARQEVAAAATVSCRLTKQPRVSGVTRGRTDYDAVIGAGAEHEEI